MGATLWLAHTRCEYARLLQTAGDANDRARAAAHVALAAEAATTHGLRALAGKIDRLGESTPEQVQLPDDLSPREVVVLRLVARGLSNREVGRELVISEHTVANHIRAILRKTGCANRTEATAYAYRHGLAAPDEALSAR
jgi:DNA-binding NarL/FixJ family response regulator